MSQQPRSPARLFLPIVSVDRFLEKDSSPILAPGLHPEAAENLLRQADDFSPAGGYEIVLQVPAGDAGRIQEVREGLRNWSRNQAQLVSQEVQSKIRKGSKALAVALVVVAMLYLFVEWLQAFGSGHLYRLFGESLIIIAWVSLWVPVETLLVEPIHLRQRRRLFLAISSATVLLEPRGQA
jgi:hypothetical protein